MPPSSNVSKAKHDAEQDNKLEFYEEDPSLLDITKAFITSQKAKLNAWNWDENVEKLQGDKIVLQKFEPRYRDEIHDPALMDVLFDAAPNTILSEVFDTKTELEYTIGEEGNMEIKSFPRDVLAIIKVGEKTSEEREKTVPAEVGAQHILFAYPGAMKAGEDVKYASKEEARAKAEEILAKLKTEGTENFAELAKEFSTEGAAQKSGGNLGTFAKGQMVKPFEEAVFAVEEPQLLDEIVETDFGFHVIQVLSKKEEGTEKNIEPKVAFEILGWIKEDIAWVPTELGGKQLDNAMVGYDELGKPLVNLLFDNEGAGMFAELTGDVAARTCDGGPCRLGIKVGGRFISKATVRQKIIGRSAQISGSFSYDEATKLADGLNLGAIDAPVILSGQITIKPELGADQLKKSFKAAGLGFLATIIFMIGIYRFTGVIAAVALVLYAGIFTSILKIWPESFGGPIVLSLAGFAGIALSVGLAVDGNILIFERIKEELNKGKNFHKAVELGFERAWSAIRDSNLTTLLTCSILFFMGSSILRGFAITLIVGTLLSMFTAVTISRTLLRLSLECKSLRKPYLFGVNKKK